MPLDGRTVSALPIGRRALKGIQWGLQMAAALAFFAIVARLAGGDKIFEGGLSFPKTLAAEFAAGVLGGIVFGVSLPVLTSGIRVAFAGLIIGAISGLAVLTADKGFAGWNPGEIDIIVPFAMLGLVVAIIVRRRVSRNAGR